MSKVTDALQALTRLVHWMPRQQVLTLKHALYSEEKEGIADLVLRAEEAIEALPMPYSTDGQGNAAIARLHYFRGGVDAWITERDSSEVQHQAFGLIDLGHGAELGYISIQELIDNGVELDLYWSLKTLEDTM